MLTKMPKTGLRKFLALSLLFTTAAFATPPAVPKVSVIPGNQWNNVTWPPVATATKYELQFLKNGIGGNPTYTITAPTVFFHHLLLTNGVPYSYHVRAFNSANQASAWSSWVIGIPYAGGAPQPCYERCAEIYNRCIFSSQPPEKCYMNANTCFASCQ